ncbi:MAG: hypothetical protein GC161_16245 [Planctomycetaceae bacterium]|nr:hypothetical protein [Planctomycetaceae bacterium]
MTAPDYGRFAPGPPTAEALALRDQLADEMAAATDRRERARAEAQLTAHMLSEGLPLEDFSTPGGTAVEVHVKVSRPKPKAGCERDARRWLNGRNDRSLAHELVKRGGALPEDLFEPLSIRVTARAA